MKRLLEALFPSTSGVSWCGGLIFFLVLMGVGFGFGVRLAADTALPRPMPSILVDPGHGGFDGGCGSGATILEKQLNLTLGKRLAARLQRFGFRVDLTRSDDRHLGPTHRQDLLARVERAKTFGADVTICLHADWSWNKYRSGPRVFYHHSSGVSRLLAETIQRELNGVAGSANQALPAKNLLVIREVKQPAILVEMGFLSHPDESRRLAEAAYQDALAEAMAVGVIKGILILGITS